MSLRDKIIDYYKILLAIGWLEADEAGNVSLVIGDDVMPATIDGKRVILPTREQMKNRNWEHRIGFHPLRESYNLGISDVLANLRDQYVQRLNASIAYLMKELIDIGYNTEGQKNLSTEQLQVMNALQQCSDTTVKSFASLQKKTQASNSADQFINIFIKKGGMVNDQTYGRAAIVSFPIYQQLVEGNEKVNGVKITGKDREMFIKLYKFIFPTIDNKEAFNVGVNARSAPFLEALIRATFGVVDQLVETSKPYMSLVAMPTILTFPNDMGDWVEIFDSKDMVEKLASAIPNLTRGEEAEEPTEPKALPSRDERREPEQERKVEITANVNADKASPRGRMILGAPAGATGESLTKTTGERAVVTGRGVSRDSDLDREAERKRREEEDRVRRQREREDEEERARRRRERDEEDRDRGTRSTRDRDDDRDRGRDRDDERRNRSRDEEDDRTRRTGDIFEDNPVLRGNLRDEEDYARRDRGRGRDRYDERDDRGGPRGRIRDLRDGGGRGRGRDDRYYDDRGRDRDDDRYDRDRGRYRR
jgi:hypothetical protein